MANAASHWIATENPALSLSLNPLNTDARVNLVSSATTIQGGGIDYDELIEISKTGIKYSPMEARMYSMLGLLLESTGENTAKVQRLYDHALVLNKTEVRALVRKFVFNASNGNVDDALEQARLVFTAWRRHWPLLEPHIPALLSTEEGYEAALAGFAQLPGGPTEMLRSLTKTDAGTLMAQRLLLDWHKQGVPGLRQAVNATTDALIRSNRTNQAFALFGLTLETGHEDVSGFIHNSDFSAEPTGNTFDWRLPRLAGVSFRISDRRPPPAGTVNTEQPSSGKALEVKFLNSPARLDADLQTLRLPGGRYVWRTVYSTMDLKGPEPVRLVLRCGSNLREFASITLENTKRAANATVTEFEVPRENCRLQRFSITNGNAVESWKNRFSGSIFIHRTDLSLAGS